MSPPTKVFYDFGPYRIDPSERILLRAGQHVPLTPKAFETLLVLVENSGHIIEKDELMKKVWPDTFVEEVNLAKNISTLRKILRDGSQAQEYIETVPKRGYRFVAEVREALADTTEMIVRKRITTRVIEEDDDIEESRLPATAAPAPSSHLTRTPSRSAIEWLKALCQQRTLLLILVALLAVLPAIIYRRQTARSSRQAVAGSSAHIQSIAVLPFNLLGDGAADVYLAQGMADTLIARLSGIRDLKVRPTSAVLKYTNTAYDPFAAGRALKADAVLEGSIHKVGDRIRVTARLLNVKDESTIWASNYTENFSDLLLMQDRISEQVAEALAVRLGSSERQLLTKHHTENVEAYQLYTKGRFFWNKRTEDGFWKAVKYFAQAIALDPDYGLAYCGLADAYALLSNHAYIPPKDGYGKGKDAAIKALEIDDALAEAHTSLAYILHNYDWDWAGAEREFRRAIELNPNYATAHHWYAIYLSKMGQHEEAIAEIKLAQQIDPTSVGIAYQVASIFYRARQYDQAIEHARQAMEIDAGFGRSTLSLAYEKKGMYREALAEMQKAAANNSDTPSNIAHLGRALAMAGRESEARQSLDRLDVLSAQRYVSPFLKARIHAALGEKDRAFDLIEKAYQERSDFMADILVDPREDNLRSDPRFQQLLRRLGLVH